MLRQPAGMQIAEMLIADSHSYYSYTQLRTPNACTNATVTQTDTQTPHDGIGRACIASRGKNNKNLAIANRSRTDAHTLCQGHL